MIAGLQIEAARLVNPNHGYAKSLRSNIPTRTSWQSAHVIEKLGSGLDARHQKMISCPRAGDVEQMALGVIDFLQVCVVPDRLDALLQGNDLVVAGHHHDGTELQALGEVHGTDRDVTANGFDVFIENLEGQTGLLDGGLGAIELRRRSDEYAEFMRQHAS